MEWTPENIKWFLDQSPPRQVDETLLYDTLNLFFPKVARAILLILPVLILVMVGMLLTFMVRTVDLKGEWRLMSEATVLTSGKVLEVQTGKGSKGSVTYIYRFQFKPVRNEDVNDPPVEGISFSGIRIASPGQTVPIEFIADDPRLSRIQGCRFNPIPFSAVALIPLTAVIVCILPFALLSHKKRTLRRLLTFGVSTPAVIEKVKAGPKGALYVELRYSVEGVELKSKTSVSGRKHEKEFLGSLHESGQPVLLLVDTRKPKSVFLVDLLFHAKGAQHSTTMV